jgi:hypothetical protein
MLTKDKIKERVFGDDENLYGKAFSWWHDKAERLCMDDPEYREIEERLDSGHGTKRWDSWSWDRQSEIRDRVYPMPTWLRAWQKVHHSRRIKPRYWKNTFIHYKQRVERGFSYQDLWNFDWYLSHLCEKAFIELRDTCHGWPGEPMTFDEWLDIHTKIAEAFKAKRAQHDIDYQREDWREERDRLEAQWREGMELFTEYYGGFWD